MRESHPPHSHHGFGSLPPLKGADSSEGVSGKVDIHDYRKRLESAKRLLQESEILQKDKELILKFTDVLRAERISLGRVAKYIYNLKVLSEMLLQQSKSDTGFDSTDKKTIDTLIIRINENGRYTPHTKRDFVIALKRFYQWLRAPPEEYPSWKRKHRYPEEVDDLSTNLKLNETTLPWDLLSQDEVSKLIGAATHPMLKAFVAFSDELGPRPGEILGMRIRDVVFDGTDLLCRLAGKTGTRVEYIVKSASLLSQWLDAHPFKDNPDSPLWLNLNNNNRHERWSYAACKKALKMLAGRAGVRKNVNPYVFRHTAASRDAKLGFTEAQLCLKYGWVFGSKMPRVYIHLAGTDLREKVMEVYAGMEVEKREPQTIKCPRCSALNNPGQNYCYTCGSPLSPQGRSIEVEELKRDVREIKDVLRSLLQRGTGA